jgi:hypothetical protein
MLRREIADASSEDQTSHSSGGVMSSRKSKQMRLTRSIDLSQQTPRPELDEMLFGQYRDMIKSSHVNHERVLGHADSSMSSSSDTEIELVLRIQGVDEDQGFLNVFNSSWLKNGRGEGHGVVIPCLSELEVLGISRKDKLS